jgi:Tfx family DNA-binding protein
MSEKETILSKRQMEVLKLRKKGYTQAEISRMLNTTRANVYALEKSALKNIKKAEKTLKFVKFLNAALWIKAEKGKNLNDLVREIYTKAGKKKIHVRYTKPELISALTKDCRDKIKGMRIVQEMEIGITKEGEITYGL